MVQADHDRPRRSAVRRVSVSFEAADYEELRRIAAEKRVSLAWVVRDAVAAYIFRRGPLFRQPPHSRPARRTPE
ncbi:MAG: ribbon-helix-helix protein, CopG family [Acidobacteriota bacterium]|nr:ribbon-helix-helix protein, CopG family [Acidobacteriota bacterium]MXX85540.1 ribbon-helix-helix protein, CopG family [Acidobacteriota bacterium]MYG75431.1 ribbon-helix-helix protein, CopG family [Acidobacteriota bacterium]